MILQSKARSLGCSLNLYSIPGVHLTPWCPSTQNTSWFRESQNTTDTTDPPRVVYIAGDTLRHQPMGSRSHGSVLVMQAYWIRILPWCYIWLVMLCVNSQWIAGHMTAPVMWVVGEFRVLHWCCPMPACISGNKMWHPDDHLIWCPKVDSGPHISLPFLVDLPLLLEVYKLFYTPSLA